MGYYVLNGREKIWVEDESDNVAQDCKRIYQRIKNELDSIIGQGYQAEFTKKKASWMLTLSRGNKKVISFGFQFLGDTLAVYICNMESRVFAYKDGFLRKSLQILIT